MEAEAAGVADGADMAACDRRRSRRPRPRRPTGRGRASRGWPPCRRQAEQVHGQMPRVRGVIRRAASATSMLKVSRSMSQNTTVPPRYSTTLAVAIQVKAGTITSSPGPNPSAARRGAALCCTTYRDRMLGAGERRPFCSNSRTLGPASASRCAAARHACISSSARGARDRNVQRGWSLMRTAPPPRGAPRPRPCARRARRSAASAPRAGRSRR